MLINKTEQKANTIRTNFLLQYSTGRIGVAANYFLNEVLFEIKHLRISWLLLVLCKNPSNYPHLLKIIQRERTLSLKLVLNSKNHWKSVRRKTTDLDENIYQLEKFHFDLEKPKKLLKNSKVQYKEWASCSVFLLMEPAASSKPKRLTATTNNG